MSLQGHGFQELLYSDQKKKKKKWWPQTLEIQIKDLAQNTQTIFPLREYWSELTCPSDCTYRCTWELSPPQASMGTTRKTTNGRLHTFPCRSRLYEWQRSGREGWRTSSNRRKVCKLERQNDMRHFKRQGSIFEYDVQLQALKQWCKLRWMTWEEKCLCAWVRAAHNLKDVGTA